ncbi:hypothetical protein MTO96_001819 [Rhipicephalus appendiculatus]
MKTFFAIALLCAASLTDAMSTITRIDSSLNEIAPSVGRVLQGGSLINDAPVDTTVRSNDVGVPMGGGLVGNLLLTRFGAPPHAHAHIHPSKRRRQGDPHHPHNFLSVVAPAFLAVRPARPALHCEERRQPTNHPWVHSAQEASYSPGEAHWGAPSSGSSTSTAFQGNWPQSGGFHYTFHGGYPAGGFGYFQNIFHPFIGHGYAGHQNGDYGSGSGYVSGYAPGYGPGYVPGYGSGYGLGSSNYYTYPGFGGYAHTG